MGVLADIDTTLKNSDISLIKNKLFTNLCRSVTNSCVAFSFYELKNLDLNIDEIELLLQHGSCRSHAVIGKIYPAYDISVDFISDITACKLYMRNPVEFYKQHGVEVDKISKLNYTVLTSGYMEEKILGCMLLFDVQTQQEYSTFRAAHLEKQWPTAYTGSSGVGMRYTYDWNALYCYDFPLCN